MMHYVSTRSQPSAADGGGGLTFDQVLLGGLAPDGGLYVPDSIPALPEARLTDPDRDPDRPDYVALATRLMLPFVEGVVTSDDLGSLVADAYDDFGHPDICPLVQFEADHWLLELFHGPTLAFKDIALQVVARLFDHELTRRNDRAMIVAATSGDTGSAAMQAVAGRDRIDIVVLHPAGRTSEVQRRQMTTLDAANVHAVAVDGTFDDCQDLVKAMFADEPFRCDLRLAAVNSINWARVMAQIVYYVWAQQLLAHQGLPARQRPVTFCVPTGNFGNVLAGHYARRMGLPIGRLLVASNSNDILSRLMETGEMSAQEVVPTLSPSMDIQISSNLERLIYELFDGDGAATAALLRDFRATGQVQLDRQHHRRLVAEFSGDRLDDDETLAVMARVHAQTGMFIDPHTAVGVGVAQRCRKPGEQIVTLATAHPSKFPGAVRQATGCQPDPPEALAAISERPERCTSLPCSLAAVKDFVRSVRGS